MPSYVAPRPTPWLETDAPLNDKLPPTLSPVAEPPVIPGPLVTRNYNPLAATDAANFQAMFMAIESQRQEVGARMEDFRYNNDMARAIEQLKNGVRVLIDQIQAEDPTRRIKLGSQLAWFIWTNNLEVKGYKPQEKFATFQEFADQDYSLNELNTVISSLEIDKSKYTDANSQYMQQMQLALGLLQVFQQLLTALIDATKRVKEQVAAKI
ncbi:hypothetical protein J5T34_22245 [Cupriavidus gilardii]|uniref:hypothetical protein n=1 Tax=Cupriavidus gilardii TaxID=82541 RepID=UPI001ABE2281|nr:hypothetical protein [Cupriavidus gilardii]MBO4123457.1 hypothetical protein [Cupriavidus gilardii]